MFDGLLLYNSSLRAALENFKKFERKIKKLLTNMKSHDILNKLSTMKKQVNSMNLENERLNSV